MMEFFPVLFRVFFFPLTLGFIFWWLVGQGMMPQEIALVAWGTIWTLDWWTLPAQSRFWYRRGHPRMALVGWQVRLLGAFRRRTRTALAAEAAWILLDLDHPEEAAHLLARHGSGSVEQDPVYAVSLARVLLATGGRPLLSMDLADCALEGRPLARAHFVRGLCYGLLEEPRAALRAFSRARQRATYEKDLTLSGFCYLHMGQTWAQFGERDYALDHFLRAEIMLYFLPHASRKAHLQAARHG